MYSRITVGSVYCKSFMDLVLGILHLNRWYNHINYVTNS